MNKSDLIEELAKKAGLTPQQSEEVVEYILDKFQSALASGGRIEIRGFGSFVVKKYKSYEGRNPKSGERIEVAPKQLPFFKVGKELKQRVDDGKPLPASTEDGKTPAQR